MLPVKWSQRLGMLQQEHITVQTDLIFLNQVLQWFEQFCQKNLSRLSWLADREQLKLALDMLKLALTEGFTNVVRHAHQDLPIETPIDIDLTLWDDRLEIRIWDRKNPYVPLPKPDKPPNPNTLPEGGYGLYLMQRIADDFAYEHFQDGRNCLLLVKRKPH